MTTTYSCTVAINTGEREGAGSMMEMAYKLEAEDVWQLYRYGLFRIPGVRNRALGSILLYPALVLAASVRRRLHPVATVGLTALFGGFSAYIWYRNYRARVLSQVLLKAGLVGDHVIRFTEEGIWDSTSDQEALTPWSNIERVVQYRGHLFLMDAETRALVVPSRAFGGDPAGTDRMAHEALRLRALRAGNASGA